MGSSGSAVTSSTLLAPFEGVSIVIPVYNAEPNLDDLAADLDRVLPALTRSWEAILVDDGSRDGSWERLRALSERYSWLRAIRLMRNYGQHNALLCGIRQSRYPIVITMDDDLQHPADEIPHLLRALTADVDVVYGSPQEQPHGLFRGLASTVTKWALQGLMGAEIARRVSAFRVFRTRLRESFDSHAGSNISIDVLLSWSTSRFQAIEVRHEPRRRGISGYSFFKLVGHAFNMLTGFTIWPLRFASFTGFFFTLFGLGVLGYVVIRYLIEGQSAPGFPFLASIISIFAGAQLFAIGIIGEYLARMHFRLMSRPTYAVRDSLGINPKEGIQ